jgi:hypothetical protein
MEPTRTSDSDEGFGRPELVLPYRLRGYDGRVSVYYAENRAPVRWVFDVPGMLASPFDLALARGYPVCEARIAYGGSGSRALMGWNQLVTNRDAQTGRQETSVDLFPIAAHLGSPFAVFGSAPTMFDAPANPDHETENWLADTFLAVCPDVGRTRRVAALLGFRWGYALRERRARSLPVEPVGPDAWDQYLPLLRDRFADWEFLPGFQAL